MFLIFIYFFKYLQNTRWWFQIVFMFIPYLGKIPNLTNIFQMGWKNHQPETPLFWKKTPILTFLLKLHAPIHRSWLRCSEVADGPPDGRSFLEKWTLGFWRKKSVATKTQGFPRWWFQIFFIFTPIWGRWTQLDEHIFQRGWNHQLGRVFLYYP